MSRRRRRRERTDALLHEAARERSAIVLQRAIRRSGLLTRGFVLL